MTKRILAVDKFPYNLKTYQEVLGQNLDYSLITTLEPNMALFILEGGRLPIDLLIAGYCLFGRMSEQSVIEAHNARHSMKVILVTSNALRTDPNGLDRVLTELKGKGLEVDAHLPKPIDKGDLAAKVEELIGSKIKRNI